MKRKSLLLFAAAIICCISCDKTPLDNPSKASAGIEGGTYNLDGITIEVPAGALDKPVDLTAKEIKDVEGLGTEVLPSGMLAVFEFGPDGTVFNEPVKVTVTLPEAMPGNQKLAVTTYVESDEEESDIPQIRWEVVDFADVNGATATFEVSHFSKYAVTSLTEGDMMGLIDILNSGEAGVDQTALAKQIENQVYSVDGMNVLNHWTVGCFDHVMRRPVYVAMQYNVSDAVNGRVKESQCFINYGLGDFANYAGANVSFSGYYDVISLDIHNSASDYKIVQTGGKTFEEITKEYQHIKQVFIVRQLEAVEPTLTLEETGRLTRKGDQETVKAHLFARHTGEDIEWNVLYSYGHGKSWRRHSRYKVDYETSEEKQYDKATVPDYEEGNMDPFDYPDQLLDIWPGDIKQLKTVNTVPEGEKNLVVTNDNGEAEIVIEALEDEVNTTLAANWEYDYAGPASRYGDYFDHAGAYCSIPITNSEADWHFHIVVDAHYKGYFVYESNATPMTFQYEVDGFFNDPVMTCINGDGEIVDQIDPDDEDAFAGYVSTGSANIMLTQEMSGNKNWDFVNENVHYYFQVSNVHTLCTSDTVPFIILRSSYANGDLFIIMPGDFMGTDYLGIYPLFGWDIKEWDVHDGTEEVIIMGGDNYIGTFITLSFPLKEGEYECPESNIDENLGEALDSYTNPMMCSNSPSYPYCPTSGTKATVTLTRLTKDNE